MRCKKRVRLGQARCHLHAHLPDQRPPKARPLRCGFPLEERRKCHNPVAVGEQRCFKHQGRLTPAEVRQLEAAERQRKRQRKQQERALEQARKRREREQQRLDQAVAYCIDAIAQGAIEAAKERAADYISEQTWQRVSRSWRGRNCVALAELAQAIMDGRDMLRKGISQLLKPVFDLLEEWLAKSAALRHVFDLPVLRYVNQALAARLARVVAQEVFERMARRLTVADHQLTATARAIQMTGIIFCVMQERHLTTCACFASIVKTDGKEIVK